MAQNTVKIDDQELTVHELLWLVLSKDARQKLADRTLFIKPSKRRTSPDEAPLYTYLARAVGYTLSFYDIYVDYQRSGFIDLEYRRGQFHHLNAGLTVNNKEYL